MPDPLPPSTRTLPPREYIAAGLFGCGLDGGAAIPLAIDLIAAGFAAAAWVARRVAVAPGAPVELHKLRIVHVALERRTDRIEIRPVAVGGQLDAMR